ncbi:MAG: Flp pilus assembly complex ATPase component TadA [Clostridia bacterium]|nr:Flp pilus assembly complex ATPase component TadA [Clostridia bacterium]
MNKDLLKPFIVATGVLPERIWRALYTLDVDERLKCEEIRLRQDRPVTVKVNGRYIPVSLDGNVIYASNSDISETLDKATSYSIHTYEGQINSGFITIKGGHRIGVCGEKRSDDKNGFAYPYSLNIRIAKQISGIAEKLFNDGFDNTLIVSGAGEGKTTLLRDSVRYLSYKYNVSVSDDRYEIAGSGGGKASFDVGYCDVSSGGSKEKTVYELMRSMTPDIIAFDEITEEKDANALLSAYHCGCGFITTLHGKSPEDLLKRSVYKKISEEGIFGRVVFIESENGERRYTLYKSEERDAESAGSGYGDRFMLGNRTFCKKISFKS